MPALDEYTARRERWHAILLAQQRLFNTIGNWRLVLGIAEASLAYLVFGPHSLPSWTLLLPLTAFIALAAWHARVLRSRTLASRALEFYDRNLARLNDCWSKSPQTGERFRDPDHVYADDLDLFGTGSLFQLVSTARTQAGEQALADWLLTPATIGEARERQSAIRELSAHLDLREDLALLGPDVQSNLNLKAIEHWGNAPPIRFAPILRLVALVLGTVSLVYLFLFFAQRAELWQLLLTWCADAALIFALRSRVTPVLDAADTPVHGLQVFRLVLERLERESFDSPYLQRLLASVRTKDLPASQRVKALGRWADWLDSGDHPLIRALRPMILWREQIAMGLERWRQQSGQQIGGWLRAVAEFEALSSFASLAFERATWSFPELVSGLPCFDASALHHPLLPAARSIANDVSLNKTNRLFIVSGSNMSGKSTLLRATGLNCVLAWAGAPTATASLRISPLLPGASIRVSDSLLDNRSRFFAEISRLRQVVELTRGSRPVLFLFDELLSGTNSHDRRIGAAAIVTRLVRDGAIGFVTTHDLALAEIAKDLGSQATNVHFDDRLVNGQVQFDYRLQPGLVTHSNALELMRAVGLEV